MPLRVFQNPLYTVAKPAPQTEVSSHFLWGTIPSMGNVAQPHSEKPVGSEVGGQDPHPWISSPVGNQACIALRLLWDLLLLKLPHHELRKQMLLGIFIFPESGLDSPSMGHICLDHFSFYIANVLLWCIQWHPLCCQQKITTQDKPLYSKRGPSLMLRAWKTYKGWSGQGKALGAPPLRE